ncbi:MAG: adenosylcobinamide-GDP ribazoletransferase [Spirochaetaceae bacterium]|jgi:adenosylcobinamide-GDP ribazoletransferase|nr:adenosylcobinamide-GDP ribazoletransferase [Spirochaetaceae bacterium]
MMFDRFFSVLSLVSRIPVRRRFKFDVSRIDFYLPVTGIFPAFLTLISCFLAMRLTGLGGFSVAAALVVQYLSFNLFHLDGLSDTADAFLGAVSREKRFDILKDSRIGVYGLFAGISAFILKLLLLYGLLKGVNSVFFDVPPERLLIFVYPVSGRLGAALIPCMTSPAKPTGLGALAAKSRASFAFAGATVALLVCLGVWLAATLVFAGTPPFSPLDGAPSNGGGFFIIALCYFAVPLLAGVLSAAFYARVYSKALGGYSGDALGAAIESGELICLLFIAAVSNFCAV